METKFFKKLLILTLLICPLAAQAVGKRVQAGEKRASGNISGGPEQQETNKKNKGQFVCAECGKSLISETALKLHKANHESERTGVYEYNCDVCGNYKTNSSSNYKLHKANHESERTGEYKFNCLLCDFKNNTLSDFIRHEKTLNHKKNMALAGWAPLTVTAPAASTTINPNRPTAQELIASVENSETNSNLHICDECGDIYRVKSILDRHKANHESERTGIWEFNCNVCNYGVNDSYDFKKHEQGKKHKKNIAWAGTTTTTNTTTNSNLHICDECGDIYRVKNILDRHKANHKSKRTGVWKFNCNVCNYGVNDSYDFKKHEQGKKHKKNMALAGTTTTTNTTINSEVLTAQEKFIEFLEFIGFDDSDLDEETTSINPNVLTAQELIDFINSEELQVTELPLFEPEDNNKPDWFDVLGGDLNNQPF